MGVSVGVFVAVGVLVGVGVFVGKVGISEGVSVGPRVLDGAVVGLAAAANGVHVASKLEGVEVEVTDGTAATTALVGTG
jgi:hypothetical protein